MISYEVTLDIDPRFAEGVETYMRQKHIPEIFSTGCFQQIHFERASSTRFRSRYQALTQAHLDRYLGDHAQHFRNDSAPISRTVSCPFAKYGTSCKVGDSSGVNRQNSPACALGADLDPGTRFPATSRDTR